MALIGAVLTLIDTRLILLLGAALTTWSAWRMGGWHASMRGKENDSLKEVLP